MFRWHLLPKLRVQNALQWIIDDKKVGVTSEVTLREADCADVAQSLAGEKGSRATESTLLKSLENS